MLKTVADIQVGARFHEQIAGGAARPRFAGRGVKR